MFKDLIDLSLDGVLMDNLRALHYASFLKSNDLKIAKHFPYGALHGAIGLNLASDLAACLITKAGSHQFWILEKLSSEISPLMVSFALIY